MDLETGTAPEQPSDDGIGGCHFMTGNNKKLLERKS